MLCVLALLFSAGAFAANRPNLPGIQFKDEAPLQDPVCNLPQDLIDEIKGYQSVADQIIAEYTGTGDSVGKTFQEMADFVDKFPRRSSGTPELEECIDHMMQKMTAEGQENVRGEQVLVPHWIRGEEEAVLISPVTKNLHMLALGTSVGTPPEGITADVLVVTSFEDLASKAAQAQGKIVVYNQPWNNSYGMTVPYRTQGASKAAEVGAVASLIRSITPYSLNTPHTGGNDYAEGVTHIPTACITIEDAEYMYRLQEKNETLRITLKMAHYNLPLTTSRNVVGEIVGHEFPNQIVGVSGHIDSWDLGQGAMDDAGGVMISVEALNAVKRLGLPQPRRTLRAILWTSEEVGLWGVADYARQHKDELADWSVVFESDSGTFKPRGLDFAGTPYAGCIVQEVLKLTAAINTTTYARYPSVSSDISVLIREGVPGLSLNNENDEYFWYHHTEADSISMQDTVEMDLNTALWTITSYVLADLKDPLPRVEPVP